MQGEPKQPQPSDLDSQSPLDIKPEGQRVYNLYEKFWRATQTLEGTADPEKENLYRRAAEFFQGIFTATDSGLDLQDVNSYPDGNTALVAINQFMTNEQYATQRTQALELLEEIRVEFNKIPLGITTNNPEKVVLVGCKRASDAEVPENYVDIASAIREESLPTDIDPEVLLMTLSRKSLEIKYDQQSHMLECVDISKNGISHYDEHGDVVPHTRYETLRQSTPFYVAYKNLLVFSKSPRIAFRVIEENGEYFLLFDRSELL